MQDRLLLLPQRGCLTFCADTLCRLNMQPFLLSWWTGFFLRPFLVLSKRSFSEDSLFWSIPWSYRCNDLQNDFETLMPGQRLR